MGETLTASPTSGAESRTLHIAVAEMSSFQTPEFNSAQEQILERLILQIFRPQIDAGAPFERQKAWVNTHSNQHLACLAPISCGHVYSRCKNVASTRLST